MRNPDTGKLSALGKTFVAVVVLIGLAFSALVAITVGIWVTLDQSRENLRHIDCIVASAMHPPPDVCAEIIAQLREDGILAAPPTTG